MTSTLNIESVRSGPANCMLTDFDGFMFTNGADSAEWQHAEGSGRAVKGGDFEKYIARCECSRAVLTR
jgi:hypothetical protein